MSKCKDICENGGDMAHFAAVHEASIFSGDFLFILFFQTWSFFGIEGLQRKHLILVFNILCDMMVASNHKYQGSEPSQAVEEATVGLARFLIPSYQPWCSYYHKQ